MWKEKSYAWSGAKRGASSTRGSTSVVEEVMTDMEKSASDAEEDAYGAYCPGRRLICEY